MSKLYKGTTRLIAEEVAFDFGKSEDIPFIRRIEASAIEYRATIIRQDYAKLPVIPSSLEDRFCLPLKSVPSTECCVDNIEDCNVYRTIDQVPIPVRFKDSTDFTFVGDLRGKTAYSYIVPEELDFILNGTRFAKQLAYYTYYNRYIYTFNTPGKKISVRGVFDNPSELLNLKNCEGKPCITDIKINLDMAKLIKEWIKADLSGKQVTPTTDLKLNDAANKD